MTDPSYEDFIGKPPPRFSEVDEADYASFMGRPAPAVPERPDALTALNQALEAIDADNLYPTNTKEQ